MAMILDTRYWILDAGFSMLDAVRFTPALSSIQYPASSIRTSLMNPET